MCAKFYFHKFHSTLRRFGFIQKRSSIWTPIKIKYFLHPCIIQSSFCSALKITLFINLCVCNKCAKFWRCTLAHFGFIQKRNLKNAETATLRSTTNPSVAIWKYGCNFRLFHIFVWKFNYLYENILYLRQICWKALWLLFKYYIGL